MNKVFQVILLLFFISFNLMGTQHNPELDVVDKIESQLNKAQKLLLDAQAIKTEFIFDNLITLEAEIENLESEVLTLKAFFEKIMKLDQDELEANQEALVEDSDYLFNNIQLSFDKIIFASQVYKDLKAEDERLSFEYHRKWNDLFQTRNRIENLYVVEETINRYYGSETELKKLKIRKKHLYNAGIFVYNAELLELKNVSQCDYIPRIKIVEETKKLLVKLEELVYIENTRDLEKSLKNDREEDSIINKINTYHSTSSSN